MKWNRRCKAIWQLVRLMLCLDEERMENSEFGIRRAVEEKKRIKKVQTRSRSPNRSKASKCVLEKRNSQTKCEGRAPTIKT